jgi:hypothetical protein
MRGITVYTTYSFRHKDPVIDEMRTLFQKEGKLSKKGLVEVENRGAAKAATYKAWFNGKTRRPQNATIMATARALGYDRKWVKLK